jgi:hypothetical protein
MRAKRRDRYFTSMGFLLAWIGLGVAMSACGGDKSNPGDKGDATKGGSPGSPSPGKSEGKLSVIESNVFAKSCALSSCHGGATPRKGLSLVPPVYDRIVSHLSTEVPTKALVQPGDPENSYLFEKISADAPTSGVRMPPNQPLEPSSLEDIRQWITAGAPNN